MYVRYVTLLKTHFFVMTTHTCTRIITRVKTLTGWLSIMRADCLCSKGSVVVLVKAPFYTNDDMLTKTRIEYVLSATLKNGELPVPRDADFAPLKTVASAQPQVVKVPMKGTFSLHQIHS